ncbi:right-handed parallel beta-helix repeat-containing protein [Pontiella sulfatireligans]|uniref:Right handed beta helix domain-containing protein n=1 Tax=Pontiella sulfatireligans TaxID=2750658 RepID=A0A6C2URC0_9BACT|nr:right-handed parallel beta-helix repeat-containing protein [Pontiella sulfatireligans]VGO22669.1 hypothetical protein SCARR_04764 [Pontiella sulfatireligans]
MKPLSLIALFVGTVVASQAATIDWSSTALTGEGDVSISGTGLEALYFDGTSSALSTTINGVDFSRHARANESFTYFSSTAQYMISTDRWDAPTASLDVFEEMCSRHALGDDNSITLNNLMAGQDYEIQLFIAQNNADTVQYVALNQDGVIYGDTDTTRFRELNATGIAITGNFTADGTAPSFSINRIDDGDPNTTVGGFVLCGYQLRAVPPPSTYYVDAVNGNDFNNGLSPATAFRTLEKASTIHLKAGESLLLTSGQTFMGALKIKEVQGIKGRPITVGSTGKEKAVIDGAGWSAPLSVIDCSYVTVKNLELTADGGGAVTDRGYDKKLRSGVYVYSEDGDRSLRNLVFEDLDIHDVFYLDPGSVHDEDLLAYGVYAYLRASTMENMTFRRIKIERTNYLGIFATSTSRRLSGTVVEDCELVDIGGPGIKIKQATDTLIRRCRVLRGGSGSDSRMFNRGTCIYVGNTGGAIIEQNTVVGACGNVDSRGIHIDVNCDGVIVQHNLSVDNIGGFVHFYDNRLGNNCYRYNVSVNDGFRSSGVIGDIISIRGGTNINSYVYNNTFYVRGGYNGNMNINTETDGALIANNIFYTVDELTDGTKRDNIVANGLEDHGIVFDNNLYPEYSAWMDDPFSATNSMFGAPQFAHAGGTNIVDYIPMNPLCRNGMVITNLPGDTVGLPDGFEVSYDILGTPIDPQKPFLGAIRPPDYTGTFTDGGGSYTNETGLGFQMVRNDTVGLTDNTSDASIGRISFRDTGAGVPSLGLVSTNRLDLSGFSSFMLTWTVANSGASLNPSGNGWFFGFQDSVGNQIDGSSLWNQDPKALGLRITAGDGMDFVENAGSSTVTATPILTDGTLKASSYSSGFSVFLSINSDNTWNGSTEGLSTYIATNGTLVATLYEDLAGNVFPSTFYQSGSSATQTVNYAHMSLNSLGHAAASPAVVGFVAGKGGTLSIYGCNLSSTASYTLQGTDSLMSTNWVDIAATSGVNVVDWTDVVIPTNDVAFYRVISE